MTITPQQIKKRKLWVTAIIVYVICILITLLFEHLEERMSPFNPVRIFFREFDLTDLYYNNAHDQDPNVPILIINSEGSSRAQLANLIDSVNVDSPSVIGIDAHFDKRDDGDSGTIKLSNTVRRYNNIVLGYVSPHNRDFHNIANKPIIVPASNISLGDNEIGFINLSDSATTVRSVPLIDVSGPDTIESLAFLIARKYTRFEKGDVHARLDRRVDSYRIKYIRKEHFHVRGYDSVLRDFARKSYVKGKIILIGDVSKDGAECACDMHYSPLNRQLVGRSFPDIQGIYVHANIINTILGPNEFTTIPDWLLILGSLLICFPILMVLMIIYCKKHHVFHFFMGLVYEPTVFILCIALSIALYSCYYYLPFQFPFLIFSISPFAIYIVDLLDALLNRLLKKFNRNSPSYFTLIRTLHEKENKSHE